MARTHVPLPSCTAMRKFWCDDLLLRQPLSVIRGSKKGWNKRNCARRVSIYSGGELSRTQHKDFFSATNSEMTGNQSASTNETFIEGFVYNKAICAGQVVQIAVLVFSIWIILCAIIYGYKTKKWNKRRGSNSLDQGIMYTCCVAAIALTLPRIIFSSVVAFIQPDILWPVCEAIVDASHGLYITAAYPAYAYLWLRHRVIFCHPTVRKLVGKYVILSGWAVAVIFTGISIVIGWAYIAPQSYTSSPTGCIIDSEKSDNHSKLFYSLAGILIVSQVSLLALFIYPMVRCELDQIKQRSKSACEGVAPYQGEGRQVKNMKMLVFRNILYGDGSKDSEQHSILVKTIRRSFYGALAATISDITVMLLSSFAMSSLTPRSVIDALYDVGISVNNLCILSTFGNSKKVLWPCPVDISTEGNTQNSSTQVNITQDGDGTSDEVAEPTQA